MRFFRVVTVAVVVCALGFTTIAGEDEETPLENVAKDSGENSEDSAPVEDNGVLVLNTNNFDNIIFGKDIVLVEFYAPWCGHCKQLAPEYEKAAGRLKENDPPVILTKVDATVESDLASRFGVSGYPTLKWFKNGNPYDYDGPRDADGIVNYMKVRADPSWAPPPEAVIVLTKDNFTEITDREKLIIVMFYAPWCGHCKRLHPEYEKAAQELKQRENGAVLAKVDATIETELASKYEVSGYPTLKIFRQGHVYDYKGDARDSWGILSYIEMQQGPASKELSSLDAIKQQLGSSLDPSAVTNVAFFESTGDPTFVVYEEAANELRGDYKFWHTFSEEARNFFKVSPRTFVVFLTEKFQTQHEPKLHKLELKEEIKSSEITSFAKSKDAPLVGEYNSETSEKTYKSKRPLVLFFCTVDWSFEHRQATQTWRKKFATVAKQFPSLTFAIADEEKNRELFNEFGFDESSEEINVGLIDEKNKKYSMKPQEEYDADEVTGFLKDYLKGNLAPKVKSQSIPRKQDGPVTIVVGKTFEKIVLDKKKDVLIELYAPWCGHCKKLEPVYKDLAKKFKKHKNLVIAKMDATANDAPDNYSSSGYPTIYFAPANNKDSPISYTGDRKLEDLVKFVKQHATVGLDKTKKDEL